MAGYYSGSDAEGWKSERNDLLADSDKYMLDDHPTTLKSEWVAFRAALRDMDFSDLDNLNWPKKPDDAKG
jgi:hypothetical protein